MFMSDFLSNLFSDNNDEEPTLYLTHTSLLNNASYMTQLDTICKFNYNTGQGICTSHSFLITGSQAKMQKIAIRSLFKASIDQPGPAAEASILRDPPAVLTRKRLRPCYDKMSVKTHLKKGDVDDHQRKGLLNI